MEITELPTQSAVIDLRKLKEEIKRNISILEDEIRKIDAEIEMFDLRRDTSTISGDLNKDVSKQDDRISNNHLRYGQVIE